MCDHLDDAYDLGRLAQTSSVLRDEVRQLERTWMRACIEASAGWVDMTDGLCDGEHASWHEAFGALGNTPRAILRMTKSD